jgi:hypothetical protein
MRDYLLGVKDGSFWYAVAMAEFDRKGRLAFASLIGVMLSFLAVLRVGYKLASTIADARDAMDVAGTIAKSFADPVAVCSLLLVLVVGYVCREDLLPIWKWVEGYFPGRHGSTAELPKLAIEFNPRLHVTPRGEVTECRFVVRNIGNAQANRVRAKLESLLPLTRIDEAHPYSSQFNSVLLQIVREKPWFPLNAGDSAEVILLVAFQGQDFFAIKGHDINNEPKDLETLRAQYELNIAVTAMNAGPANGTFIVSPREDGGIDFRQKRVADNGSDSLRQLGNALEKGGALLRWIADQSQYDKTAFINEAQDWEKSVSEILEQRQFGGSKSLFVEITDAELKAEMRELGWGAHDDNTWYHQAKAALSIRLERLRQIISNHSPRL